VGRLPYGGAAGGSPGRAPALFAAGEAFRLGLIETNKYFTLGDIHPLGEGPMAENLQLLPRIFRKLRQ
jgi:hypothetical protein